MIDISSSNPPMPSILSDNKSSAIEARKEMPEKSDLDKHITEETKKSVNYQIINKLLIEDKKDLIKEHKSTDLASEEQVSISDKALFINASLTDVQGFMQADSLNTSQTKTQVLVHQSRTTQLSFSMGEPIKDVQQSDPIILDLNGDGIKTSGVKDGVYFDINADGLKDRTSYAIGGDAFLAYDKNGNGIIDDGSELFGDQNGAQNGYEELSKYDDNQDGLIDQNDSIYEKLSTLSFYNEQQNIVSIKSQGIESVNTNYTEQINSKTVKGADDIAQTSTYTKNGTRYDTADVLLAYSNF